MINRNYQLIPMNKLKMLKGGGNTAFYCAFVEARIFKYHIDIEHDNWDFISE